MESMGRFSETTEPTDSEDHQRTPGARMARSRLTSPSRRLTQTSRTRMLEMAISRLEQEHVALLMALCELEASKDSAEQPPAHGQDAIMRGALELLLREDLRRTQHALRLEAQGIYGLCEVCQRPLSRRHLSLLPAVTRCTACAGRAPQAR